jgi:hypothetical protein
MSRDTLFHDVRGSDSRFPVPYRRTSGGILSVPPAAQNSIVKNIKTTEDYEDPIVRVISEMVDGNISLLPVLKDKDKEVVGVVHA